MQRWNLCEAPTPRVQHGLQTLLRTTLPSKHRLCHVHTHHCTGYTLLDSITTTATLTGQHIHFAKYMICVLCSCYQAFCSMTVILVLTLFLGFLPCSCLSYFMMFANCLTLTCIFTLILDFVLLAN